MDELINILHNAPKSCAECQYSEWVNDPYATGDSPGGYECGNFHCEYAQAEKDLTAKYDEIEREILKLEPNAPEVLYDLLEELDGILGQTREYA